MSARPGNSSCNACGYRGIREGDLKWCPACWEDEGGELILDPEASGSEADS